MKKCSGDVLGHLVHSTREWSMMALSFSRKASSASFKHNWLGAFGPKYPRFPPVLLGAISGYIYLYIYFFYQLFFLGNAENISHISVKVISFRNDTDSQKVYFMTPFLDFLCDPQGELTLWPPPVLPNGQYSHHLRVRQKLWSLWVPSQLKNQISNGRAWLNSLGTQNYFIHLIFWTRCTSERDCIRR